MDTLNPAQLEAVNHIDGPMLVLAGPGSGKTRVVTHRIANLIQHGIAPRHILAMTFTNKAAQEMQSRVEQQIYGNGISGRVWVSTFHKFCAWQIRKHGQLVGLNENYTIYDTADCKRLLKACIDRVKPETKQTPAGMINAISKLKSQMITPELYEPGLKDLYKLEQKRIYAVYQAALQTANAVDFDDLLLHTVTILQNNEELRADMDAHYRYVLVDEYQDTNLVQYEIVKLLNQDYQNLSVTGDPDQSIYGWRGAEINNILNFEKDYPNCKVVRLEANYRSTPEILRVADTLIANNTQRKEKTLFTDNPHGAPVHVKACADDSAEAAQVIAQIQDLIYTGQARPKDIAVFYRMNAQSRPLEDMLNRNGIRYILVNALEFYQRKEIKDVMGYLRLLGNAYDDISFLRIVNEPTRGIGETTINKLQAYAFDQNIPLLQAAMEVDQIPTIKNRSAKALKDFTAMMDRIFQLTGTELRPLVQDILDISGYREQFAGGKSPEDEDRLANIDEFLNIAGAFDDRHKGEEIINPLTIFLEECALIADSDKLDGDQDCVSLMTIHSAKGLEFPYVFVVGLEDGTLPHQRSLDSGSLSDLEEERRLLFVAITRAKKELFLSLASRRRKQGFYQDCAPSLFLMELPRTEMDCQLKNEFFDPEPDVSDDELEAYPSWFPKQVPTGKRKKAKGNPDGFCDEISDGKFTDEWE